MATVTRISARGGLPAPVLTLALILALLAPSTTAAGTPTPGSLVRFPYAYADSWTGWPVAPLHKQHPVRGSFLDPRGGYHFGIDISVDDSAPEQGAPPGRTHRVYAVEGGTASFVLDAPRRCMGRRLTVGHFAYWHVDPVVAPGQRIRPGQVVGWTCRHAWHVHLSEWTRIGGRLVWVNPLHQGGKLRPYVDQAAPVVHEVRFFAGPAQVTGDRLRGRVDVRARISDPQSFRGWMTGSLAPLYADHHPYALSVRITRLADGRTWLRRVFRADATLSAGVPALGTPVPYRHHYAPTTYANLRAAVCVFEKPPDCTGQYWLRLFANRSGFTWDTRAFRNGRYRLAVTAADIVGNRTTEAVEVAILN
ncbi:MAG: hypothetical protein WD027_06145 [Gaiellales bacterium]